MNNFKKGFEKVAFTAVEGLVGAGTTAVTALAAHGAYKNWKKNKRNAELVKKHNLGKKVK